jgi:uncharacterized protein YacL
MGVAPLYKFKLQAIMNRVVRGIFGGALFGGFIFGAITFAMILVSAQFVELDVQQQDAEPGILIIFSLVLATHGLIMGGLAGMASQLPKTGVSFFRCFLFVSVSSVLTHILTRPSLKIQDDRQRLICLMATFAMPLIATGILLAIGFRKNRDANAGKIAANNSD